MRKILFVDDEPLLLEGLQDSLRRNRKRWDMRFANGGQAAVDALSAETFDVLVTDMRMPGVDGPALLKHVTEQYPSMTRIILSGQADRDSVLRALPLVHQFVTKPCDIKVLESVLERATTLRSVVEDETIRSIVGRIVQLPSPPNVYRELTHALSESGSSLAVVAKIIESDPAMCAKMLQLVNSACFGVPQRITQIQQAARYLGLELLRNLTLSVHVFGMIEMVPPRLASAIERIQDRSVRCAKLARSLQDDLSVSDDTFAAGLTQDIGILVLAMGLPDALIEILDETVRSHRPAFAVERERLGVTHADIGAYLLGTWGLPMSVVEAVAYHHEPGRAPAGASSVLGPVHVADLLVDLAGSPPEDLLDLSGIDVDFMNRPCVAEKMRKWSPVAAQKLEIVRSGRSAL